MGAGFSRRTASSRPQMVAIGKKGAHVDLDRFNPNSNVIDFFGHALLEVFQLSRKEFPW